MKISPLHAKDFYKVGHVHQYPKGINKVYANFTARSGRLSNVPKAKGVVFIGLQLVILEYLIQDWNENFFLEPKEKVVDSYKRLVDNGLGYSVDVSHIEALHDLGYLPLEIKAVPEGSFVPYGVPMFTIVNTLDEFFWLPNMLESVISAELWRSLL